MTNLNDFGNEYEHPPLTREELLCDPIKQFETWIVQAIKHQEHEPNAMTLATVTKTYQVSARMMLLKYFDENGFVFFSNYTSNKAAALEEINQAALLFWWPKSARQVRIQGIVSKLDSKHSDDYFAKRSKASQCAALISKQSSLIASKESLMSDYTHAKKSFEDKPINRPDTWGGYLLKPIQFEFWQGRPHRLHDRFVYQLVKDNWAISQLSP